MAETQPNPEGSRLERITKTSKKWLGRAIKYAAIGAIALGVLEVTTGNIPLSVMTAKLGHGLHVLGTKLGHGLHHVGDGLHDAAHSFNEAVTHG